MKNKKIAYTCIYLITRMCQVRQTVTHSCIEALVSNPSSLSTFKRFLAITCNLQFYLVSFLAAKTMLCMGYFRIWSTIAKLICTWLDQCYTGLECKPDTGNTNLELTEIYRVLFQRKTVERFFHTMILFLYVCSCCRNVIIQKISCHSSSDFSD